MYINIFIFLSKILENTLSTLRLIVVANGKKKLGAILNGIIALCWVFSTSIVIININKDILSILSFCMGAGIGSYLGSIIEEKIALGNIILICNINNNIDKISNKLNKTFKIYKYDKLLILYIKRNNIKNISDIIKKYDTTAYIIGLKAKNLD